jgi:hypothetical protein
MAVDKATITTPKLSVVEYDNVASNIYAKPNINVLTLLNAVQLNVCTAFLYLFEYLLFIKS